MQNAWLFVLLTLPLVACATTGRDSAPRGVVPPGEHPRLFFSRGELARLRALRGSGHHAVIWRNIEISARWCLNEPMRRAWIAPVTPDPNHENLYDRFYAMMHDMAVAEYLAFAFAYSGEEKYFVGARDWLLTLCRVWSREAEGDADGGKAYAATRLLKGLGVGYDLLHDRLTPAQRDEVRGVIVAIADKYDAFFNDPKSGFGPGYEPHHGSVDAASLGIAALALLGETPRAQAWLDTVVRKHETWLFPAALTPQGTHQQTPTFWTSIMQYRIAFMDALRRGTGRDLFIEQRGRMPWTVPLATIVGRGVGAMQYDHPHLSSIFGMDIGSNSPVLFALAREYREPTLQHLALWDTGVGSIAPIRSVTPHRERYVTNWGAYAYAWYDASVKPAIDPTRPRSFLFNEPDENPILHVNEAFVRASYELGAVCAGQRRSLVVLHAGGRPVFIDFAPAYPPPKPVLDLAMTDDGTTATITSRSVEDSGYQSQTIQLQRPGQLVLRRKTAAPVRWWCHGSPTRDGDTLRWPDGATLRVTRGRLTAFDPRGHRPENIVGLGALKLRDLETAEYPAAAAEPADGELVIEVRSGR